MRELSPNDCKNEDDVIRLQTDHVSVGGKWCIGTDGWVVWFSEQRVGEAPKQEFDIPKKHFDRLVAWYVAKQKVEKAKGVA